MANYEKGNFKCLAPWKAILVHSDGSISPDHQFKYSFGNLRNGTLKELMKSTEATALRAKILNGEVPEGCENCIKKEKSVGHSRRIFFDHKLNKNSERTKSLPQAEAVEFLELNLSNLCNLKCRMCNSVSSSSWISEEKLLATMDIPDIHLPIDPCLKKVSDGEVEKFLQDPESLLNLKYVALRGGEPLMNIQTLRILQKLIDWGVATRITLDLSTNGTIFSEDILRILEQFKSVDFYVSVEACGDLYAYIRGGSEYSLKSIHENLKRVRQLSNTNLIFVNTVSVYNVYYLSEWIDWVVGLGGRNDELSLSNVVVRPEFLNFQILPLDFRLKAQEKLKSNRSIHSHATKTEIKFRDTGYEQVCRSLGHEIFDEQRRRLLMTRFVAYNQALDKLRGTSLLKVAPELAKITYGSY